jgi:hypothetical protein
MQRGSVRRCLMPAARAVQKAAQRSSRDHTSGHDPLSFRRTDRTVQPGISVRCPSPRIFELHGDEIGRYRIGSASARRMGTDRSAGRYWRSRGKGDAPRTSIPCLPASPPDRIGTLRSPPGTNISCHPNSKDHHYAAEIARRAHDGGDSECILGSSRGRGQESQKKVPCGCEHQ